MTIAELITKAATGGTLTDEEKKELSKLDLSKFVSKTDSDAAVNAAAAGARREAEEKATALQKEKDKLASELEATKDKDGTEAEKLQKQIAALTSSLETVTTDFKEAQEAERLSKREGTVVKLTTALPFAQKNVTPDYANFLVTKTLADLDDASIINDAITKPLLAKLQTDNPNLFSAETPNGTGSRQGDGGASGSTGQELDVNALLKTALTAPIEEAEKAIEQAAKDSVANPGATTVPLITN